MRNGAQFKWTVAIIVVLALVGGSTFWYMQSDRVTGDVVATVNGVDITEEELHEHLEEVYGREALETLIVYQLITDSADSSGMTPNSAAVDAEIDEMKAEMGEVGFEQLLTQYGMTEDALRYNILISISLDEIRYSEVEYSEEDLKQFFEENPEYFDQAEEVRASHILVEDEESAESILAQLADGENFAELAESHSLDPGSSAQGGDLGFFQQGMMYQEFEDVAFALEIDELSEPIQTDAGFHIIKVTEREEAEGALYKEVRDEVQQLYLQIHAPQHEEVIHRLQNDANIQIHRPDLELGGM